MMKGIIQTSPQKIVRSVIGAGVLFAGLTICAQPSSPPHSTKGERTADFTFEVTKPADGKPGTPPRASSSSAKKASAASKSRSAEIRAMTFSDSGSRINRPLIIKSGNMTAKVRDQLREDLLVMCRILEKAARDHLSDPHKAAGIDLFTFGGNRSVRTMYLDEYGVIFTLNVRMPLRNEAKAEEPETKEATVNEEWEETRSELFGQKRRVRRATPAQAPAYDENDVEDLKGELIDALKNAVNIRDLKPTEWITVAVSGPSLFENEVLAMEARGDEERFIVPKVEVFGMAEAPSGGDSTMILRVRKGAVDEIIKKNPTPEELSKELEKAVSVQVY
jgi:hypothetical protein